MLNTSRSGSLMFMTTTVAIYIQGGLKKKETELNFVACFLFQHLMNSVYLPNVP